MKKAFTVLFCLLLVMVMSLPVYARAGGGGSGGASGGGGSSGGTHTNHTSDGNSNVGILEAIALLVLSSSAYLVYRGKVYKKSRQSKKLLKEIDDLDKKMCMDYINSDDSDEENISWDLICIAMRSVADTCVIPVQDFLGLDESARINTPSTLGDNWKWRMTLGCFSKELIDKIKRLTKIYGRI